MELDKIIEKEFDDVIRFTDEDLKIKKWLSWGNYALNYICSKDLKNGVPQGKITSISGLSGTGKSLLTTSLIKDKKVDSVIIFETEGSPVEGLLSFVDVDLSKVFIVRVETFASYKVNKKTGVIEEVADSKMPVKKENDNFIFKEGLTSKVRRLIHQVTFNKIDKNILVIVDSLANLQSIRALSGGIDMGKKGQDIGNFFRSFDNAFEKSKIYFVFTNKLYQSFNEWQPYVEACGVSVIYNPSLSIQLSNTNETDDIADTELREEKERRKSALGSSIKTIKATIKKSRFGTEMRNVPFLLDFSTGGLSRLSGLFTLLKDFGVIENATTRSYNIPGVIDKPFYKKDFILKILDNEEEMLDKIQVKLNEREEEILKEKVKIQMADIVELEDIIEEEILEGPERSDMVNLMSRDIE